MTTATSLDSEVESARMALIDWWNQGNNLGEGDYEQVASKVQELALKLPTADMTLYYHSFRWGFDFSFGEKLNQTTLIPVSPYDSRILRWQMEDRKTSFWPLKDPETNSYFLPKVTVKIVNPPSGSTTTGGYLQGLLKIAELNPLSRQCRIIEALAPYAQQIKNECGESVYERVAMIAPGLI